MPGTRGCRKRPPFLVDDADVEYGKPAVTIGRGCVGGADVPVICAGCRGNVWWDCILRVGVGNWDTVRRSGSDRGKQALVTGVCSNGRWTRSGQSRTTGHRWTGR